MVWLLLESGFRRGLRAGGSLNNDQFMRLVSTYCIQTQWTVRACLNWDSPGSSQVLDKYIRHGLSMAPCQLPPVRARVHVHTCCLGSHSALCLGLGPVLLPRHLLPKGHLFVAPSMVPRVGRG